jgi:hypothetical protein
MGSSSILDRDILFRFNADVALSGSHGVSASISATLALKLGALLSSEFDILKVGRISTCTLYKLINGELFDARVVFSSELFKDSCVFSISILRFL